MNTTIGEHRSHTLDHGDLLVCPWSKRPPSALMRSLLLNSKDQLTSPIFCPVLLLAHQNRCPSYLTLPIRTSPPPPYQRTQSQLKLYKVLWTFVYIYIKYIILNLLVIKQKIFKNN
ncbi:hypothetical protein CEXT_155661 [Caerostris extrusa]|uniref:Uncharacterized protein n=1 Tax=Caerostris extrusa TaxID=172846 RepID=A0AAV4MQ07_CAEEX|nr:hypothetical protein CEXT_155661 [Caerostris extrusa]